MECDQIPQDVNQGEQKRARVSQPSHQNGTARVCEGFTGINENQLHYNFFASLGSAGTGDERDVHAFAETRKQQQRIERGRIENGKLVGVKDGWVLFALHPTKGLRVVNEGIVPVGDERIICGGSRQGFFAAPIPDDVKDQIRINDIRPPTPDKVLFPNLFMLAPSLRKMAKDVAKVSRAGIGEVTHPHEIPEEELLTPGVDSRIVGQVYRAARASAMRGEIPQPPEVPADETLPPGADARVVAKVYQAVVARSVKDAASGSGDASKI